MDPHQYIGTNHCCLTSASLVLIQIPFPGYRVVDLKRKKMNLKWHGRILNYLMFYTKEEAMRLWLMREKTGFAKRA